jgi:hypothetical protein
MLAPLGIEWREAETSLDVRGKSGPDQPMMRSLAIRARLMLVSATVNEGR